MLWFWERLFDAHHLDNAEFAKRVQNARVREIVRNIPNADAYYARIATAVAAAIESSRALSHARPYRASFHE